VVMDVAMTAGVNVTFIGLGTHVHISCETIPKQTTSQLQRWVTARSMKLDVMIGVLDMATVTLDSADARLDGQELIVEQVRAAQTIVIPQVVNVWLACVCAKKASMVHLVLSAPASAIVGGMDTVSKVIVFAKRVGLGRSVMQRLRRL